MNLVYMGASYKLLIVIYIKLVHNTYGLSVVSHIFSYIILTENLIF